MGVLEMKPPGLEDSALDTRMKNGGRLERKMAVF